jgi:glycosyltransferase involved in cell wall biosynthesis
MRFIDVNMQIDGECKCGGKRLTRASTRLKLDSPLFAVVTVVFNGAEALEATIHSVLSQSYKNFEYIVIDGGSTDGTLDLLRKYEHSIDYWVSEPDKGVYDAFNKACRLITGEWTIFLGAGDVLHDESVLESMSETVSRVSAEIEIVYGKVCLTDSRNRPFETLNRPWEQMRDRWQGGRPVFPHHQGIFHRRPILAGKNPFDTTYRIAADSKVFYDSMKRATPVFADLTIATSTLGGLSTDPKYYVANIEEIVRINREMGFANFGHELWFSRKSAFKYALYKIGGDKLAKRCVDIYRKLTGRRPKWLE